jgi:hypothetical protein
VSVQVTTPTAGATVRPASRSYGNVKVDVTKTNTFTVSVPASFPLGATVGLNIRVSFAGALSPQSATKSITVGQPGPARDFTYTGPAVAIPDGNDAGVNVPLPVSGVGNVARATFSVGGTSCSPAVASPLVGLDHTFVGDLVGSLVAPDGTSVTLFARRGLDGNKHLPGRVRRRRRAQHHLGHVGGGSVHRHVAARDAAGRTERALRGRHVELPRGR